MMLSIKYSEIPFYLYPSSFYESLIVEDIEEEIEIPEQCYAQNDTVANEQDFVKLLQVTAFWGFHKVPLSVIVFCSSRDNDWAARMNEMHAQLPFVQDLFYIFFTPVPAPVPDEDANNQVVSTPVQGECPLIRAIKRGRSEIVEYLALTPSSGTQATTTAAELGRLDILQALHKHGHAWNESTCTQAMQGGHLDCLRYLHENGCPWHIPSLHSTAAHYNQLACLKYLIEQGIPWHASANSIAAYGNLDMLRYAWENGFVFDRCATGYAAEFDRIECLRYLLCEANCPVSPVAIADACSNGHLACVQLLHKCGALWDNNAPVAAARGGYLACIQYLHENGCPWDKQTTQVAARLGDYDMLHYLISHGCPYSPWTLNDATYSVTEGGLRCFRYLLEEIFHFNDAFARGNYYLIQYLFERDAEYKNHAIVWPLQSKWWFQKLHLDNHINPLTKLDVNILKCIQCALENSWEIEQCGGEMVKLIAEERVFFPQSFECVKPWFEKGLGTNK